MKQKNKETMTAPELIARRERLLGAGARLFYKEPVNIVRGESISTAISPA